MNVMIAGIAVVEGEEDQESGINWGRRWERTLLNQLMVPSSIPTGRLDTADELNWLPFHESPPLTPLASPCRWERKKTFSAPIPSATCHAALSWMGASLSLCAWHQRREALSLTVGGA